MGSAWAQLCAVGGHAQVIPQSREQRLSSCFTKERGFGVVSTDVGERGEQDRGREGLPCAGTADILLHSLVSQLFRGKANKTLHIAQAFETSKLSFSDLG